MRSVQAGRSPDGRVVRAAAEAAAVFRVAGPFYRTTKVADMAFYNNTLKYDLLCE